MLHFNGHPEGIHNDATCDGDLTAGKIATTSLVRILAHFLVMPFFSSTNQVPGRGATVVLAGVAFIQFLVILKYPEETRVEKVVDVCLTFFLFAQSVILYM